MKITQEAVSSIARLVGPSPARGAVPLMAAVALLLPLPCEGQAGAEAGDTVPAAVGPEEALELFGHRSLDLRAARADFRAAVGRASQAAAYPNPSASFLREDLSRGEGAYSEHSFTLRQTVEWPGRTLARSRAASRRQAAARATFRSDSLDLVLGVWRAYLRAAEAEGRVEVLERVAGVFREAVQDAGVRRREGDISGYELRRLKLERARLEQSLAAALIERDAARRELAARVVPRSDTVALATRGVPEGRPSAVSRDALLASALDRPSLAAGRRSVRAAEAEASAARLRRVPDLQLTGGYKTQSDDFDGAVLGVSLSLPIFDRKSGAAGAAEARASAAEARLGLRRRRVRNEVLRALDRYRSVRRRSRVVGDELLTPSEDLLEIARTAYDAGEMELVGLLDGADAYREARLTALELRSELWLAYRELVRAAGGEIDQSGDRAGADAPVGNDGGDR